MRIAMLTALCLVGTLGLVLPEPARADGILDELAVCLAGPGIPESPPCVETFDADADLDVDLHDAGTLQVAYTGDLPTGACCLAEYGCEVLTETGCTEAGGTQWLGADTDCADCVVRHVRSITFGGSGFRTVRGDCPNPPCTAYGTPQWLDNNNDGDVLDTGDKDYPVAYVRDNSVVLSNVKFYVSPSYPVSNVPVRGFGPDGLEFTGTGSVTGSYLNVTGTLTSSVTLPDTVRDYADFDIDWEIALDGEHFYSAGTSQTRMYVTYASPLGDLLESYFDISTEAADGAAAEQDVIDAIWAGFADLEVYNAGGEPLAYYRDVLCASECWYYSAPELVYYTTSQCGGWADLMIQCLKTQGIGTALFITIEPNAAVLPDDCGTWPSPPGGFIVKNYTFYPGGTPMCPAYPFTFNDPCGYYSPWAQPRCVDAPGLPGQDNPNPASWFARHFIVKINGAYYDPSYGAGPFTGSQTEANQAWEQNGIAGYFGVAQPSPSRAGTRIDVFDLRETYFDQ